MQWEWVIVALVVVFTIRAVWFSKGNAKARRSLRYVHQATSVMKEVSHFTDQFSRVHDLDNSRIAVATLRLQQLNHEVRSWNPPERDRERHRHLLKIVTYAADEWEGGPNISREGRRARQARTNDAVWEYLKTQGWKDRYTPPPRNVCHQTRISAFFLGNRC